MTNIKIGDASIRVTLDPQVARRDLDRLRAEMERIEEAKKRAIEESERVRRGEPPTRQPKADPNAVGGPRKEFGEPTRAPGLGAALAIGAGGIGGAAAGAGAKVGAAGALGSALRNIISIGLDIAPAVTRGVATGMAAVADIAKGTFLEGATAEWASSAKRNAEWMTRGTVGLQAVADAGTDMLDFNLAVLKLDGKLPQDQMGLAKKFLEVNYQQGLFKTNMAAAVDQHLAGKGGKAMADATLDFVKAAAREAGFGK